MNTLNRSCLNRMNAGSGDDIVDKLKHALATEYYAYHMYRSAYNMAKGLRRTSIIDELKEHSEEELEHADMLEDRIRILGGNTFSDPTEWDIWNDYAIPSITSSDIGEILVVIKQSEQDAVSTYSKLYSELADDPVSQDIMLRILSKEQEHLFDVQYNMIGLTS